MTEIELAEARKRVTELEAERSALWLQMQPITYRLGTLDAELRPLREAIAQEEISRVAGPPNWKRLIKDVADDCTSTRAALNYMDDQLHGYFDMYHSGLWVDTQEANIQIKLVRGSAESLRKNTEGVKLFAGILTPHSDQHVWFSIFEHTRGEYGSYILSVTPDIKEIELHHDKKCLRSFATLDEAMTYLQDNHYYASLGGGWADEDGPV